MSIDKIFQLAKTASNKIEDSQKYAIPTLVSKLEKHLLSNPEDKTSGLICNVLQKMSMNNQVFISRENLKKLYSQHYSNNTKFASILEESLGDVELKSTVQHYSHDIGKELDMYTGANPVLANALDSVFSGKELKAYSNIVAKKALVSVGKILENWNLKPSNLVVEKGNEQFLIIRADYETPKGLTSFYIPVETYGDKVAEASVFIGNTSSTELNNSNIKNYITGKAGSKLKITSFILLDSLTKAASKNEEVSDAELAAIRLQANKKDFSTSGSIVGQKIAEASIRELPSFKSDHFEKFEKELMTVKGSAVASFGNKVKIGADVISRDLNSFGVNHQISVINHTNDSISYVVKLNNSLAFTVPVKVSDNKVIKPNVMICNGSVSSFNKESVAKLINDKVVDYKLAATASEYSAVKPSELIDSVREAMSTMNFEKAEDALNVLANSGDKKAHALAFKVYMDGLSGKKAEQSGCSMMIKNSKVSEKIVCGHTNLPIDKVYQDNHGSCKPLYRRNMEETYEGASFMNAKILG